MMTENALITNADLIFTDIGGRNGRNFKLQLTLKTVYGGCKTSFNPLRLPQLLEQLGLEKFSELKGTYIQINDTNFGEEVKGILSILAKDSEEWFETENNIYFGSEFFKGYDTPEESKDDNMQECINDVFRTALRESHHSIEYKTIIQLGKQLGVVWKNDEDIEFKE